MMKQDKVIQFIISKELCTRHIELINPKIYDKAFDFAEQNFILPLANKLLTQDINLHIFKGIAHLNGN